MLEVHRIRDEKDKVIAGLKIRNLTNAEEMVEQVLELDEKRRDLIQKVESDKQEMNIISKSIGKLMSQGKREEADAAKAKTGELKQAIKERDEELGHVQGVLQELLYQIPNVPHPSVPAGNSDTDNEVVYQSGETPKAIDGAKPHWELADSLDIIDFALGAKITGAGFPVFKGKGAKLERALIAFFLDQAEEAGYTEMIPPLLVNEASGYGTGQLPDKEGQMYHVTLDDLYLIPTAEVPITNLYREEILSGEKLPIKNCGYTQCFRREAGAYGAHVRGLNRLHQFDKVEIVELAHPDTSYERLDAMVAHVRGLLEKLGLPFRILRLCGGDIGFTSALTFDFEVWSSGQERWLEVSSVSNFETFQANRLKCRFRDENGKKALVHTLNGSALALPRIVAGILENYQNADGTVRVPEALVPYTRFDVID